MTSSAPCVPECLGIPVHYRETFTGISDSRGLWKWKKIVVGPVFTRFPPREQAAILLHEAGHCKLFHVEQRLRGLWRVFVGPEALVTLCREQELAADRFVAGCGYGADLARVLSRLSPSHSPFHPAHAVRIAALAAHKFD